MSALTFPVLANVDLLVHSRRIEPEKKRLLCRRARSHPRQGTLHTLVVERFLPPDTTPTFVVDDLLADAAPPRIDGVIVFVKRDCVDNISRASNEIRILWE